MLLLRIIWFDFCFTALQHILGHFGRGQLTYPHCSWASLLGSLPVLSAHSFASNWQLLFLNQRKRENGRRNVYMTKSPRKNVPDVGIELGAACMPSEQASDRATTPGLAENNNMKQTTDHKLPIPVANHLESFNNTYIWWWLLFSALECIILSKFNNL